MLTACPVVLGLMAAGVYAVGSGFASLPAMVPVFVSQIFGGALFVTAYLRAASFAKAAEIEQQRQRQAGRT